MDTNSVEVGKHLRHLEAIDYNTDGSLILGCSSLTNRLWNGELLYFNSYNKDLALNKRDVKAPLDCGTSDIKWINGTRRFLVACDSGAVELWELSEEKDCLACVAKPIEHDNIVSSLSVNASKAKFLSTSYDKLVMVWDMEEFLPVSIFKAHYDIVWCGAFHSSNPDIFASCSQDGRVLMWDLRQSKPASLMEGEFMPSLPTCVAWQPNTDHSVAISTDTGHVLLQDCRVGVGTPNIVQAHSRSINRLAFAPHRSNWVASSSEDCTFAVTSFTNEPPAANAIFRNEDHQDFVRGLCWNPVSHELTTSSWDGTVQCHAVTPEQCNDSLPAEPSVNHMS